jgi:hypothetical protein
VTAVPEDAIAAAAKALIAGSPMVRDVRGMVRVALEAAAPHITAAERQRCAALLTTGKPLAFLRRHGLEPGAGAGQVLWAAATEILADGGDAPGRPSEGPPVDGQRHPGVLGRRT